MPLPTRLRSLDVFRGFVVAGMIVINSSGSDDVYPQLQHSSWNGLTVADLVFPAFLVILGVSAALSHRYHREQGHPLQQMVRHAAIRAVGLFALGLLINFFTFTDGPGLRWPGVLQRIAICSISCSALLMLDKRGREPIILATLLITYWVLLTRIPVPGHGAGILTPEGNLASWLDRKLMSGHIETPLEDPEGILSTLGALATTVMGLWAGKRLVRIDTQILLTVGAVGLTAAFVGTLWSFSIPLNKHLWTSSYSLISGGVTLAALAVCVWLFEKDPPKWSRPFESLGRHALAAYVGAGFVYGVLEFIVVRRPGGQNGNLKLWMTETFFSPHLQPRAASLAFAVCLMMITLTLSHWLTRRKN